MPITIAPGFGIPGDGLPIRSGDESPVRFFQFDGETIVAAFDIKQAVRFWFEGAPWDIKEMHVKEVPETTPVTLGGDGEEIKPVPGTLADVGIRPEDMPCVVTTED